MKLLSRNAIEYTVEHFIMVINLVEVEFKYIDYSSDYINYKITHNGRSVNLKFTNSDEITIDKLLKRTIEMKYLFSSDGLVKIPTINKHNEFATANENSITINAEIVSLSFIVLSRYEESITHQTDLHDRFEFKNSLSSTYNFNDLPLVDEYACLVRDEINKVFSETNYKERQTKIIPTHDIDVIRRFTTIKVSLKTLFGDIYIYKSFKLFLSSLISYVKTLISSSNDPYLSDIIKLADISSKYGLKSEFYFMATKSDKFNNGYSPSDLDLLKIFEYLNSKEMIVGIHGGYYTYKDEVIYKTEKSTLESILKRNILYNRQHYLRFDINKTFEVLESAGIKYDSTLGYAEAEGFRAGTCYAFHPYNFKLDKSYSIVERPLIAMDVTLTSNKNYNDVKALESLMRLYNRCKAVGGDFVILWHNNYVSREHKQFNNIYLNFLHSVVNA